MRNIKAEQQIRLDIIRTYIDGSISSSEGANGLQVTERHFRRLVKDFKQYGLESLFHRNIGNTPKNKIDDFTRRRIIKLYRTKYLGFNLAHFREKLYEIENFKRVPSYTTIRNILSTEKIYAPQPKKRRKSYPRRKRYEREGFTNLQRALTQIGIICIQANTPQAKGRVERLFRTLQSRLVSELRLRGVKTIDDANEYLKTFVRNFNKQFVHAVANPKGAWEHLSSTLDIDSLMCIVKTRIVSNGEVISYKNARYVVKHPQLTTLYGQVIELRLYRSGQIRFFYQNEEIEAEGIETRKGVG